MVQSMMSFVDLSLSLWGYALKNVAFALNITPSKAIEKTLYEILSEKVLVCLSYKFGVVGPM